MQFGQTKKLTNSVIRTFCNGLVSHKF